jgi:uncharacterized protein YdaT
MEKISPQYYEEVKHLTEKQRMKLIDIIDSLKKDGHEESVAIKIAMIRLKDAKRI